MGSAIVKVAAVVSSLLLVGGLVSYRAGAFDRWTQPAATPVPGDAIFSDFEEPVAAESFIYSTKSAPIFIDPSAPLPTPSDERAKPDWPGQPSVKEAIDEDIQETQPSRPPDSQGHQGGSKSAAVFVPYDVLDRDPQAINAAKAAAVQPAAPAPAANTQNNAPPRRVIMSSSKSFVIEANPKRSVIEVLQSISPNSDLLDTPPQPNAAAPQPSRSEAKP